MDGRNVTGGDDRTAEDTQPPLPFLVGEIGTATTRLTLIDLADGIYRLIARAEAPSTLDAPTANALAAVWSLIPTLESITGRVLVSADPADPAARYHLILTTSAAGIAPVAIMALADASAHEATNATRGIYARVVQDFSLDDADRSEAGWLNEHLSRLSQAKPEALVLVGGVERGAQAPVARLARLARLVTRSMRPMPWILYAGNGSASAEVRAVLGDVTIVPNLRPTATTNRLEPARAALRTFYATQHLPGLPGADALEQHVAWGTVADNQGTMVRFLAARYARRAVFLDVGATHASGHAQADEHYSQVVLAGHGVGAGAATLEAATGTPAIERWLPYGVTAGDTPNRLFNRAVWGSGAPADAADLLLDHALLREAFHATLATLRAARPTLEYDLVVAAGALARSPSPGLAALTLIDALALDDTASTLAVDLYLDSLGLFAASGALAHVHPDAAACVLEQDALNSGPLATLLVPQGSVVDGQPALDVELTLAGTDDVQRATVHGGQIVRLPLPRNARGTLRVQPTRGVHIGANAAGAEVTTEEGAIVGSTLGVIIDARPRPLHLPADDSTRIARLRAWLSALDALPQEQLDAPAFADVSVATPAATLAPDATAVDEPAATHALVGDEPAEIPPQVVEEPVDVQDAVVVSLESSAPATLSEPAATGEVADASAPDVTPVGTAEPATAPILDRAAPYTYDEPAADEPTIATEHASHYAATEQAATPDETPTGRSPSLAVPAHAGAATVSAADAALPTPSPSAIDARRRIARVYAVPEPPTGVVRDTDDTDDQQDQAPVSVAPPRGAVMKDDAPEPAPPPRKKRRFLWW